MIAAIGSEGCFLIPFALSMEMVGVKVTVCIICIVRTIIICACDLIEKNLPAVSHLNPFK